MNDDENLARTRFMMLNAVRLIGLVLVLFGIAIYMGKVDLPEPVAYVLVALGFFEFFFMPNIVSRKWRTPDE